MSAPADPMVGRGGPVGWIQRWLQGVTMGAAVLPLAVLFGIYFFDEFDTAAFNVLAPEIKRAFHLSNQGFSGVVAANLLILLGFAVPMGYFGDRLPRRKLVVAGAVVAGTFSFMTGVATGLLALVLFRIGNGAGILVNDPIHRSLLSDYYKAEARGPVFATHANSVRWAGVIGPLTAGLLALLWSWRLAFMVLIVPIGIMAVIALRLPPVVRGQSDDRDLAVQAAEEDPVSFPRAVRMLWTVSTLRRQYFAWIPIGAAVLPLAFLFPLYLDKVFHLNPLEIGVVVSAGNAAALFGVQLAGRWTQRWMAQGLGEPLKYTAWVLIAVGPFMLVIALAPNLAVAVLAVLGVNFVGGMFYPPFYFVQSMVSPARLRSLSFAFGSLFLAGGLLFYVIFLSGMGNHSSRVGIGVLTPFWILGGVILWSAKRFVTFDATRAFQVLATTVALRHERTAAGERSLVACRNVDVAYGQTQVLFGVNFDVREGEIIALLGTNGAGKSTLLKCIAGSLEPSGGAIFFDGKEMTGAGPLTATAAGIVIVPGGKGVFPGLTVGENFALASWLLRRDESHIRSSLAESLGFFPVLQDRWDQKAGNLSGGEQQMLTIAMAMLAKPKLLMIDELSLGLAPKVVEQLLEVVRQIHDSGVTVVLVEQSVNVALTLASRAVFMEKGEVRFDGPTADLLDRPDILRSVFLEGAAAAVGVGAGNGAAHGDSGRTNGKASGQAHSSTPPARAKSRFEVPVDRKGNPRPPTLSVSELSVTFGGIRAVDSVDISVYEGQIVGVIGPNGAGKTTVFDAISGFLSADRGKIVLAGHDISHAAPDTRARLGLGRSFQDARLFPTMTVKETISVALERHIATRDPLAAALASPATRAAERQVEAEVDRLVELMRLGAFVNKFIFELSTGSRRIVDLACVLAHQPRILLLDEPSSGIAQRETEALGPLLLDIRDETGAGMIVIEHDMPLITSISDEMVALELGAVVTRGLPHDVTTHPQVVAAYLGASDVAINRSGEVSGVARELRDSHLAAPARTSSSRGSGSRSSNGQKAGSPTAKSSRPPRKRS